MHLSNYFHVAVAIRKPQSCRDFKLVVNKMVWCKQNTNLKEKKKLYLPHFKGSYLYGAGKKVLLFSPPTHWGAGENFEFRKDNKFVCKNPAWWNSFFAHPAEKIINFLFFWNSHERTWKNSCNELILSKHCTIFAVIGMATMIHH